MSILDRLFNRLPPPAPVSTGTSAVDREHDHMREHRHRELARVAEETAAIQQRLTVIDRRLSRVERWQAGVTGAMIAIEGTQPDDREQRRDT